MELELIDNGSVVNNIDFGRPETGTSNIMTLYLRNKSQYWPIKNIRLVGIKDEDLTIEYPKSLKPADTQPVIISWKPKFERRKPLETNNLFTGDLEIG